MKRKIFSFLVYLLSFVYRKRYILFENWGGYSDSPRKIYEELKARGYHKKYKFVWASYGDLDHISPPEDIENNCLIVNPFLQAKRCRFIQAFSKAIILCDRQLNSYLRNRIHARVFYITHGSPVKDTHAYYPFNENSVDYIFSSSPAMIPWIANGLGRISTRKILGLGYPRNDDLLTRNIDLNSLFKVQNQKFIAWYPTFRKRKTIKNETYGINSLPLLHNVEVAREINEYAKIRNSVIILKPHRCQDLSIFKDLKFSNIILIDDEFFVKNEMTSYQFLGNCDGLISDYSSVTYDFTLCDKPIALIWEDIEEYRKFPGIVSGIEKYLDCAHKIYNVDEMKRYLDIVQTGNDPLEEIRKKIKYEINYSVKPDNASRLTDFIIKESNL